MLLPKAVSQLLWPEKIARSGFPWEKTTKRSLAPPDFLRAALTEGHEVRLSSRKAACNSKAPPTSTGNPGSVFTNCETAVVTQKGWKPRMAGVGEFVTGIECGTGQRSSHPSLARKAETTGNCRPGRGCVRSRRLPISSTLRDTAFPSLHVSGKMRFSAREYKPKGNSRSICALAEG